MVELEGEIWYWYHNISECYYHIQLTVKYRKVLLDEKVQQVIVETLKGFKERYAIEPSTVGFDQNHVHILCRFLPKYSGGASNKGNKEYHGATDICTGTGNQEGIMGRGVLDRRILHSDD